MAESLHHEIQLDSENYSEAWVGERKTKSEREGEKMRAEMVAALMVVSTGKNECTS